jgi:hypothetical protein
MSDDSRHGCKQSDSLNDGRVRDCASAGGDFVSKLLILSGVASGMTGIWLLTQRMILVYQYPATTTAVARSDTDARRLLLSRQRLFRKVLSDPIELDYTVDDQRYVFRLKPGETTSLVVQIRYIPDDPRQAILDKTLPTWFAVGLAISLGVGFLFVGWQFRRRD